jgi:hypothetical protein
MQQDLQVARQPMTRNPTPLSSSSTPSQIGELFAISGTGKTLHQTGHLGPKNTELRTWLLTPTSPLQMLQTARIRGRKRK